MRAEKLEVGTDVDSDLVECAHVSHVLHSVRTAGCGGVECVRAGEDLRMFGYGGLGCTARADRGQP